MKGRKSGEMIEIPMITFVRMKQNDPRGSGKHVTCCKKKEGQTKLKRGPFVCRNLGFGGDVDVSIDKGQIDGRE